MDKWNHICQTAEEARKIISELPPDKKVVYTYGVWDLLHPGHVRLLTRARELGDFLIVGVVADEPVRELKGKGRPTQGQGDRLSLVGSLRCVDIAIPQNLYDPTPEMTILGRLNILTKGNDWERIPGEKTIEGMGGRLVKLSYSKEYSSSSLISKISGKQVKPSGEPEI